MMSMREAMRSSWLLCAWLRTPWSRGMLAGGAASACLELWKVWHALPWWPRKQRASVSCNQTMQALALCVSNRVLVQQGSTRTWVQRARSGSVQQSGAHDLWAFCIMPNLGRP